MSTCEKSTLTPDNYSAYCTLSEGHEGKHTATRSDGRVIAIWEESHGNE